MNETNISMSDLQLSGSYPSVFPRLACGLDSLFCCGFSLIVRRLCSATSKIRIQPTQYER